MAAPARKMEDGLPALRPTFTNHESRDVGDVAKRLDVETELDRLVGATSDLFPGDLEIRVETDFDEPYEPYFEFRVNASGKVLDLVARHSKWHESLVAIAGPRAHYFSIWIHVESLDETDGRNGCN